ncbi:MAG TPA: AarF/ABC1/UbiB kinase family protein [Acidobacteriota bacterium]|nr:AarF/ABC1/UbiB kinase family protein [Acidobacteriota bacterium]
MSTVLPSTREIEVLAPQASLPAIRPKAEAPSRLEYGFRLLYVIWVLAGFGLYLYCDLRGWLRKRDQNENTEQRMRRQAARLRERLIKLGPTFIKIGQALGTRADLLPVAYVDELAKLQNRVPAFPNREAYAIIERELGRPPQQVFARFEPDPIAAASLGQVYRARLQNGKEVVVKVQRPHLETLITLDLVILRRIGRFLLRYPQFFKGADWLGMIDEFERVIHEEMDYRMEGRNAERFKKNFASWPEVHVPIIYWEYSTSLVLTMEFIQGIRVTDAKSLAAAGINARQVNEVMHRAYFKQLLEDGFFHADPHPGNILVMRDGRLAFFDFGMVGRITPKLQSQMVSAFFHILDRDFDGIVNDLISLEFLSPEVNLDEFRPIVVDLFKRKVDIKLSEVRFKDLTYELGEIIYKYPFTTPTAFTFIMRALMTLEGISIQMNPEFNFLEVARPYARDFLFRRDSAKLREKVWQSLHDVRSGKFDWHRLYTLAKSAVSLYFA